MLRVTKLGTFNHVLRRGIANSAVSNLSFNVQDQEDFQKRVLEATTPIIVDFHAKYVQTELKPVAYNFLF